MNVLAFESIDEYREVLADRSYIPLSPDELKVPVNKALRKHLYHEWNPDYPYVIINIYEEEENCPDLWGLRFNGKRMVVSENSESPHLWPNLVGADVYIKHNNAISCSLPNFRIGCYSPHLNTPFYKAKKYRDVPKKIDVFFAGVIRMGRKPLFERVKSACEKAGVSCKIADKRGRSYYYDREKYIEMMCKARIVITGQGKGTRQWREWDAMYCGAMLLHHPGMMGIPTTLMRPGEHYEYMDFVNFPQQLQMLVSGGWEEYARRGRKLGEECFLQAPTIDIRTAALHLFGDYPQFWTVDEIKAAEQRLFGVAR